LPTFHEEVEKKKNEGTNLGDAWQVDQSEVEDLWGVNPEANGFAADALVRPSNPRCLTLNLGTNLLKISENLLWNMSELAPLSHLFLYKEEEEEEEDQTSKKKKKEEKERKKERKKEKGRRKKERKKEERKRKKKKEKERRGRRGRRRRKEWFCTSAARRRRDIVELENQRPPCDDVVATREEIASDDVLQHRGLARALAAHHHELWKVNGGEAKAVKHILQLVNGGDKLIHCAKGKERKGRKEGRRKCTKRRTKERRKEERRRKGGIELCCERKRKKVQTKTVMSCRGTKAWITPPQHVHTHNQGVWHCVEGIHRVVLIGEG